MRDFVKEIEQIDVDAQNTILEMMKYYGVEDFALQNKYVILYYTPHALYQEPKNILPSHSRGSALRLTKVYAKMPLTVKENMVLTAKAKDAKSTTNT